MDKKTIINEVRQLIGEAETESAIEKLLAFLEGKPGYIDIHSDVLQARSQFEKTRRDESQGLISYDEARRSFNQVNNQILNITEQLERAPSDDDARQPDARRRWALPAGILALLIVGVAFMLWRQRGGGGGAAYCPDFDRHSVFNVMLLPFKALDNQPTPPTHLGILSRFNQLSDKYEIDISSRPLGEDVPVLQTFQGLLPTSEAENLARECRAGLIIWGTTERAANQQDIYVRTRYKFAGGGDKSLALQKYRLSGARASMDTTMIRSEIAFEGTLRDTIRNITSVTDNPILTEEIEYIIKLLFGIIANEKKYRDEAIASLQDIQPRDTAATAARNLILADAYLAKKDPERAIDYYDAVLQADPNNSLALNNQAALYEQRGDYVKAAEKVSRLMRVEPGNRELLAVRGALRMKNEQWMAAKQDLNVATAEGVVEPTPQIQQTLKTIDSAITRERNVKKQAERRLLEAPDDPEALLSRARSAWKLGDKQEAVEAARKVLRQDARNLEAIKILADIYLEQKDADSLRQLIDRASRAGISRDQLLEEVPSLQKLIERRDLQPEVRKN